MSWALFYDSSIFFQQILLLCSLILFFYEVNNSNYSDQNTPKNANINFCNKNIKPLCSPLKWWHWNLCFVNLVKRYHDLDICWLRSFDLLASSDSATLQWKDMYFGSILFWFPFNIQHKDYEIFFKGH